MSKSAHGTPFKVILTHQSISDPKFEQELNLPSALLSNTDTPDYDNIWDLILQDTLIDNGANEKDYRLQHSDSMSTKSLKKVKKLFSNDFEQIKDENNSDDECDHVLCFSPFWNRSNLKGISLSSNTNYFKDPDTAEASETPYDDDLWNLFLLDTFKDNVDLFKNEDEKYNPDFSLPEQYNMFDTEKDINEIILPRREALELIQDAADFVGDSMATQSLKKFVKLLSNDFVRIEDDDQFSNSNVTSLSNNTNHFEQTDDDEFENLASFCHDLPDDGLWEQFLHDTYIKFEKLFSNDSFTNDLTTDNEITN